VLNCPAVRWLLSIVFLCSMVGAQAPAFGAGEPQRSPEASALAAPTGDLAPQPLPPQVDEPPSSDEACAPMAAIAGAGLRVHSRDRWAQSSMPGSVDRSVPLPPPVR